MLLALIRQYPLRLRVAMCGGRRLHFRTDDNYTSARAGGVVTC
jgi:hypothetical protein